MGETLGNYENAREEIVDNNEALEQNMAREINDVLKNCSNSSYEIAEEKLDNITKEQLIQFLALRFFPKGVDPKNDLKYSEIKKSGPILWFSMKAALKFLIQGQNDTTKYNKDTGLVDNENGKSVSEILEDKGGIDLDEDNAIIRILQDKVHATVDGKPGAQTIALVISVLGGDILPIYESVNTLYSDSKSERFQITNIAEFSIGDTKYKYDKNQFNLTEVEGKYYLTINGEQKGKEITVTEGGPTLKGFTFGECCIKKWENNNSQNTKNTSNTPKDIKNTTNTPPNTNDTNNIPQDSNQQSSKSKHDSNPKIPKDWDSDIEVGKECTQDTIDFIHENGDKLSFTETNKKEYLSLLDYILYDGEKSPKFYSFIKLGDKFWKNYRLTCDDLKNFNKNAGNTSSGRGFSTNFYETGSENLDYYIYRDNKIIKQNEGSGNGNTFKCGYDNNESNYHRFNSIECFCKYIAGTQIETARENVRNLSEGKEDISYRSEKINPDILYKTATLKSVGFGDDSDNGLKRRKTFISLLELPEHFRGNYKLSEKDINNFAKGMKYGIFNRGNATVFHTEGNGKKGINKNKPMFEVDGSSSENHRSDRRFSSVENFFYRLDKRIIDDEWPK